MVIYVEGKQFKGNGKHLVRQRTGNTSQSMFGHHADSQYLGQGALSWHGIAELPPGVWRGRPHGRGSEGSILAQWNSLIILVSRISNDATHNLSSGQ